MAIIEYAYSKPQELDQRSNRSNIEVSYQDFLHSVDSLTTSIGVGGWAGDVITTGEMFIKEAIIDILIGVRELTATRHQYRGQLDVMVFSERSLVINCAIPVRWVSVDKGILR